MHAANRISHTARQRRSPRLTAFMLSAVLATAGLIVAGCGGSSPATTTTHHTSTTKAAAKAPTPTSASGLSGKWSGQYSGAYSGTFSLNWTQSGSKLNGRITLSNPAETTGIDGTVNGGSIKFGTVSGAVYNGTVSGSSMSGSYQTPAGGGSWSANKA